MKMNGNSILILILLASLLFVGYKWYFTNGDKKLYKSQVKELREDNKHL